MAPNYAMSTAGSLNPANLLLLFLPDFFGGPDKESYWGPTEYVFGRVLNFYAGTAPFALALYASIKLFRKKTVMAIIAGCLLSFFLALGEYNPLFKLIYQLPGFGIFRRPGFYMYLFMFGFALLAGFGISHIRESFGGISKKSRLLNKAAVFALVSSALLLVVIYAYPSAPSRFIKNIFDTLGVTLQGVTGVYAVNQSLAHTAVIISLLSALYMAFSDRVMKPERILYCVVALLVFDLGVYNWRYSGACDAEKIMKKNIPLENLLAKNEGYYRIFEADTGFWTREHLRYPYFDIFGYNLLKTKEYSFFTDALRSIPRDVDGRRRRQGC